MFLPLKTADSATSTFETSRRTVDVGTFYIALGPLLKTSFQRVCFKAMRTLQHLRLWPSQTNHPIWQEAGVRNSTDHLKTIRIHLTCTHSEKVPESFGRFLLEKRPEQSTYCRPRSERSASQVLLQRHGK